MRHPHFAAVGGENRKTEDNTLITLCDSGTTAFYRIYKLKDESLVCRKIQIEPFCEPSALGLEEKLPWHLVGVAVAVQEERAYIEIRKNNVRGKAIMIRNMLFEFKTSWLQSKATM